MLRKLHNKHVHIYIIYHFPYTMYHSKIKGQSLHLDLKNNHELCLFGNVTSSDAKNKNET